MRSGSIASAVALALCAAPSLAQTAPAAGSAPAPATGVAAAGIQAQLAASARPGRIDGNEASAIYKRYLDGIGRPMPVSSESGSGSYGASMGRGGGQ
jgi:hypothetical protein